MVTTEVGKVAMDAVERGSGSEVDAGGVEARSGVEDGGSGEELA